MMMIHWNKERVVFAVSVIIFALVVVANVPTWTRGPEAKFQFRDPQTGVSTEIDRGVRVEWFQVNKVGAKARNPFLAISEWRPMKPDLLPLPPLGALERRVPLPAPMAQAPGARPPRELEMPKEKAAQEDESDEGDSR